MLNRGSLLELKNIIYRHEMFEEIFVNKNEEKYLIAEYFELKFFIEENHKFNTIIKNNKEIKNKITKLFTNFIYYNKSSELILKELLKAKT